MKRSHYYTGLSGDEKVGRVSRWKRISRWVRYRKFTVVSIVFIVLSLGYIFKYGIPGKMRLLSASFQDQAVSRKGLSIKDNQFVLNGNPFRIYSGSIHYFRVPKAYWRDRLAKLKAVGLNTVDTYVAWNMHEEIRGQYDFSGSLDLVEFLNIAHDLGLYVILRPGPYICAEWDWGGLPVWLMANDPKMEIRSLNDVYIDGVEKFFTNLFRRVAPLQYSNGGPIIAVQIENEFGAYNRDMYYMIYLQQLLIEKMGVTELLFTSDGPHDFESGNIPGVFAVVNFNDKTTDALNALEQYQPGKPLMIGEFWPGWFDHWGEKHHVLPADDMARRLEPAFKRGASINFYMFHGGTNFGFMNGANLVQNWNAKGVLSRLWGRLSNLWSSDSRQSFFYRPTITSYDYDAPLNEFGGKTEKYEKLKELLEKYQQPSDGNDMGDGKKEAGGTKSRKQLAVDPWTSWRPPAAYGEFNVAGYVLLTEVLDLIKPIVTDLPSPRFVEKIEAPEAHQLWYGFVAYRTTVDPGVKRIFIDGIVADRMQVIVNGNTVNTMESEVDHEKITAKINVEFEQKGDRAEKLDLILLVENKGRANFIQKPAKLDGQYKGFEGQVKVDGVDELKEWKVYSIRFKTAEELQNMVASVTSKSLWKPLEKAAIEQPAFFRMEFEIKSSAVEYADDTFVSTAKWGKGVIYANGLNLGRYSDKGPQRALYLPGPWLKKGTKNELVIFELESPSTTITMQAEPSLGEPCPLPCYS